MSYDHPASFIIRQKKVRALARAVPESAGGGGGSRGGLWSSVGNRSAGRRDSRYSEPKSSGSSLRVTGRRIAARKPWLTQPRPAGV